MTLGLEYTIHYAYSYEPGLGQPFEPPMATEVLKVFEGPTTVHSKLVFSPCPLHSARTIPMVFMKAVLISSVVQIGPSVAIGFNIQISNPSVWNVAVVQLSPVPYSSSSHAVPIDTNGCLNRSSLLWV